MGRACFQDPPLDPAGASTRTEERGDLVCRGRGATSRNRLSAGRPSRVSIRNTLVGHGFVIIQDLSSQL